MSAESLLLSIRPEFAEKIFAGTKTVELRRVRPRVNTGDIVVVYVSSPVKALVGAFEIDKVVEDEPSSLWTLVEKNAGVTRKQYDSYYSGASLGFAMFVKKTWSLPEPIELEQLRNKWSNFRPPQSYHYIPLNRLREFALI